MAMGTQSSRGSVGNSRRIQYIFVSFVATAFIVWPIIRARMRRRQWQHEERMAMVEKGIVSEGQTGEADLPSEESPRLDKILLTGLILASLGLVLMFRSFGFFLFLLGIGLIALYFIHHRSQISRKGNKKFLTSGVIIAAIGAGVWADSFGLFLLVLGSGLIGFYFLSQREKRALLPSTSECEPQPQSS